jgi:hypothetical protein
LKNKVDLLDFQNLVQLINNKLDFSDFEKFSSNFDLKADKFDIQNINNSLVNKAEKKEIDSLMYTMNEIKRDLQTRFESNDQDFEKLIDNIKAEFGSISSALNNLERKY